MADLGSKTSPELAEPAVVLLPLGSTEQHGPHLPVDTDTRIALAVAERAAAATGALVAPAVAYGSSGEHHGFPGTMSMGQAALELVVVELVRSLGPEVSHVMLVNGHGGNVEALRRAERTLVTEGRPVTLWSPRLAGADAHAGHTETSILLALAPDVVRLDQAEAGNQASLADLMEELRTGGVAAVSANGVLGDPTGASEVEGHRLLDAMVADLAQAIHEATADPVAR